MKQEDDNIWQPSFWTDPLNWLWNKPQEWCRQLRFWHNPAPGPDFKPVQDEQGKTYWLRQTDSQIGSIVVWRLYYRGEQVGEANGLRSVDEEEFDVGNLEVDPVHRGRSLGSVLLRHIEAEARQQGATIITGRVVAKDAAAFPGLLAWYQAQGYAVQAVEAVPSQSGPHDVVRISKVVDAAFEESHGSDKINFVRRLGRVRRMIRAQPRH